MSKAPYTILIFLTLLTFASVSGLHGFMAAHGGTAGGHLFSSVSNIWSAPLFLRAEVMFADGTLQPYNHHAPLFFWLQSLVTWPFATHIGKLTAAYYFSAAISAATLWAIYCMLRHTGISQWPAVLGVAAVAGTRMYATYRGFITFDILSPLLATLFILAITRLESAPTRTNIRLFTGVSLLALLISYYAVTVIAVYLGYRIIRTYRAYGVREALTTWPFYLALILGKAFLTILALLHLQEYLATGTLASLTNSLNRQEALNTGSLPESPLHITIVLARRVIECLPLLPLAVAAIPLAARARPILAQAASTPLLRATWFVTAGTALFVAATPVWSKIHPFAFLWLTPVIATWVAVLLQHAPRSTTNRWVAISILVSAPAWLLWGYARDYAFANATKSLLTTVETYTPTAFQFTTDFPKCGDFTGGHLMYIGSQPNHWLQQFGTPVSTTQPYVSITCNSNGSLTFTPHNGAKGAPATVMFGGEK